MAFPSNQLLQCRSSCLYHVLCSEGAGRGSEWHTYQEGILDAAMLPGLPGSDPASCNAHRASTQFLSLLLARHNPYSICMAATWLPGLSRMFPGDLRDRSIPQCVCCHRRGQPFVWTAVIPPFIRTGQTVQLCAMPAQNARCNKGVRAPARAVHSSRAKPKL